MLKGCLGDDRGLGSVTVEDEAVRKRGQFLLYSLPFSFAKVSHCKYPYRASCEADQDYVNHRNQVLRIQSRRDDGTGGEELKKVAHCGPLRGLTRKGLRETRREENA